MTRRSSERELETALADLESTEASTPREWADAVTDAVATDSSAWGWAWRIGEPDDDHVAIRRPSTMSAVSLTVPREAIPDRFDPDDDFPIVEQG